MRSAVVLLLMLAAANLASAQAIVEGVATADDAPLPGCTVDLVSKTLTRSTTTNSDGEYRFDGVAEGEYEVVFDLAGVESAKQRLLVRGDAVTVPPQDLRFVTTETITLDSPCFDEPPAGRLDRPRCSDYELHTALIDSWKRGDSSSLQLLHARYATADTYAERHRLAEVLLRNIPDDTAIWNELLSQADIAVRFPDNGNEPSPEYLQWAAERNVDPNAYWWMARGALQVAGKDPRSHALLVHALATDDEDLVYDAISSFAAQHDLDALPLIDSAIARNSGNRESLAMALSAFFDGRADAVAMKYVEETSMEQYDELRSMYEQEAQGVSAAARE
jgi:Carboxypeptidase regulatory-like domain